MKYLILVVFLLLIGAGVVYRMMNREGPEEQPEMTGKTEEFIQRWLQNDNGTFATYIQDSGEEDEDLVQGRETLAETVGLVMYYALEKGDQTLFDEVYDQFTDYFLEANGFVNWKLNEEGISEVSTNALIDDVRIMDALVRAHDEWGENRYMRTARRISGYLNQYNVNNGIYTNFYETEDEYASEVITLSYIDIQAMETLVENGLLDAEVVARTAQVVTEAPLRNGFYPVSYDVEKDEYAFDENSNMVNQAIVAYHLAQVGERSEDLLEFVKNEMQDRGLVHGVYNLETKEPTVDYESPAIYGFLILFALEVEDEELAEVIYERLKAFQVMDRNSEYYGGYSITEGDTHIFDNLVPLLAEQAIRNQ